MDVSNRRSDLRSAVIALPKQNLRGSAQGCQRCAQLVRGVCQEAPHPLLRLGDSGERFLEAADHPVECRSETPHLVLRANIRSSVKVPCGYLLGSRRHPTQWTQRETDQEERSEAAHDQRSEGPDGED